MGQYFLMVNTTKKEYLNPHKFGNGLKYMEVMGSFGMANSLVYLLGRSNGDGGAVLTVDFCKQMIDDCKGQLEEAIEEKKDKLFNNTFNFDSVKYWGDLLKAYKKQLVKAKKIKYLGSWIGDTIIFVGDYDDNNLYEEAYKCYKDISEELIKEIKYQTGISMDENEHYKIDNPTLTPDMIIT